MSTSAEQSGSPSPDEKHDGLGRAVHHVGEAFDDIADESKTVFKHAAETVKQPAAGGAIIGAVTVGAAVLFGLGPAALATTSAMIAYRLLKKSRSES